MEEAKHLKAEWRQKRFDHKKFYGSVGASFKQTCRHIRKPCIELEIERPCNDDYLSLVSEVDEAIAVFSGWNDLTKAFVNFDDERLREFQEFLADTFEVHESYNRCGQKLSSFFVPGIGWQESQNTAAKQKARFERLQLAVGGSWEAIDTLARCYVQIRPCKVLLRFRDTPPDYIAHPSLLDKQSSLSCSASDSNTEPGRARVHENNSRCCWSPPGPDYKSHFLQVDLGSDCDVNYISTQGRFPPLQNDARGSICKFTGAQIMDELHINMRQWVWKYEVLARIDSGRSWFSLGTFDGNRDMTTEVAHKLLTTARCRYLRFRVLGFDRVPSMRVGVYGNRLNAVQARSAMPVAKQLMVEYRFVSIAEGRKLDKMPAGSPSVAESHWYHCPLCPHYTSGPCHCKKRQRHLRRIDARRTMREEKEMRVPLARTIAVQPLFEEAVPPTTAHAPFQMLERAMSSDIALPAETNLQDTGVNTDGWLLIDIPIQEEDCGTPRCDDASDAGSATITCITPLPESRALVQDEWILG